MHQFRESVEGKHSRSRCALASVSLRGEFTSVACFTFTNYYTAGASAGAITTTATQYYYYYYYYYYDYYYYYYY